MKKRLPAIVAISLIVISMALLITRIVPLFSAVDTWLFLFALFLLIAGIVIGVYDWQQRFAEPHLTRLAYQDELTGLMNRRGFLIAADKLANQANHCVLVLDINDFKAINDYQGHAAGDQALQALATLLQQSVRDSDLVCRWGGDEFVILLKNTGTDGAVIFQQRLTQVLSQLADESFSSVTCGYAVLLAGGDVRQSISEADNMLITLKQQRDDKAR